MAADFQLYESILWTPGEGWFLRGHHLRRLLRSAAALGFRADPDAVEAALDRFEAGLRGRLAGDGVRRKVRLVLHADGAVALEDEPARPAAPVALALAAAPVDGADPFLRHKTTRREVYARARAAHPEADDVLLWNQRRELTETCTANVVLELDGRRLTPAEPAGLLPGTFRAHLLETGAVAEARLTLDDLPRAERLWIVNSVRRWCEARLRGPCVPA